MSDILEKPKNEEIVETPKLWAPMIFSKCGKSGLSYKRFCSEEECVNQTNDAFALWEVRGGKPTTWIGVQYEGEYFCQMKDYSHFIPMPVNN